MREASLRNQTQSWSDPRAGLLSSGLPCEQPALLNTNQEPREGLCFPMTLGSLSLSTSGSFALSVFAWVLVVSPSSWKTNQLTLSPKRGSASWRAMVKAGVKAHRRGAWGLCPAGQCSWQNCA